MRGAIERQPDEDEQAHEGRQRSEESYESPKVEDIPVDQTAVTSPGAVSDGSPDVDGDF
jgi:hypothetical protein